MEKRERNGEEGKRLGRICYHFNKYLTTNFHQFICLISSKLVNIHIYIYKIEIQDNFLSELYYFLTVAVKLEVSGRLCVSFLTATIESCCNKHQSPNQWQLL